MHAQREYLCSTHRSTRGQQEHKKRRAPVRLTPPKMRSSVLMEVASRSWFRIT